MSAVPRFTKPVAASLAGAGAVYLLLGLICRPSWRASAGWVLHSWRRPADREAHWQQAIGDAIDPWDRVIHDRGGGSRGGSRGETQQASSIGR